MNSIELKNLIDKLRFTKVLGNTNCIISSLQLINRPTNCSGMLAYATNNKYVENVKNNNDIICVITEENFVNEYFDILRQRDGCIIVAEDAEYEFYRTHEYLVGIKTFYTQYDFEATIGDGSKIAPSAVICKGVKIGKNVTIGANTVIRPGVIIDDDVTIGCNSTIGSEGFQIIRTKSHGQMHVSHIGRTHICRNVYIGDNTCICNYLFDGETYVGENTKIDNLVYVAHNLYVGKNVVITAGVMLCGSSIIEDNSWIGVNSSILNDVVIGNNSLIGIGSVVTRSVPANKLTYGVPAKVKE